MVKNSRNIRKKQEFLAFIKTIKGGTVCHWQDIANAIGVDNDTITAWKRLPEAQEAIKKGIERALNDMQRAGKKDWRMWESKLKMLGIIPKSRKELDITTTGKELPIPIMGGISKNTLADDS